MFTPILKKKCLFVSLLLFLFHSQLGLSQSKTDSLKSVLKSLDNKKGLAADSIRYSTFISLGYQYKNVEPDSSLHYFLKAKTIAALLKDELNQAKALNQIGWNKFSKGNYDEALILYAQALAYGQKYLQHANAQICKNANTIVAETFNEIGSIYANQGNYPIASENYFKALKINEKINNKIGQATNLVQIGYIFDFQKESTKALTYFYKALKIVQEIGDEVAQISIYGSIGNIYSEKTQYQKALDNYNKSLELIEKIGDVYNKGEILGNIGVTYFELHNYTKALENYTICLKIAEKMGKKYTQTIALCNIGELYIKQKKYQLAQNYLDRSIILANELESIEDLKEIHRNYSELYYQTNQQGKALHHYKKYIIYRDSIINDENTKASMQKEMQYNYDKMAVADSLSNAKEQMIKEAKHQAELKVRKNQQYALFVGLALVLIFAGFIYNRFKITQSQKNIIEKQKIIVDESQAKILASINYAQKIQYSILPSSEEINALFPEHFIYFMPKDIVSGDFYWFHHYDNLSFIAVADCTGHGVPGAFMTMIAHSNLIEVVVEQKITDPGKILSNLHTLIFTNLQQHKGDEYSQDGLDISLVVIDHNKGILHFSGARNNGYIVKDDNVQVLKATAKSIGGLSLLGEIEPKRSFNTETIQLSKDALLVLSTDGLLDQLNANDEKFGNQRFKDLLLNLNKGNNVENLKTVNTTYDNWKANAPQLDDLLVMGLKIHTNSNG